MSLQKQIMAFLWRNPGAPVEEMAQALGQDAKRVRNSVHGLKHAQWVSVRLDDVTQQPGYTLTALGRGKVQAAGLPAEPPRALRAKPAEEAPAGAESEGGEAEASAIPPPQYDPRSVSFGQAEGAEAGSALAEVVGEVQALREAFEQEEASARVRGENLVVMGEAYAREETSARIRADRVEDLSRDIESLHGRIAELLPESWPIDPSDMSAEEIVNAISAALAAVRAERDAAVVSVRAGEEAVDVKDAARGYLVRAPKRRLRVFYRGEAAVAAAMAAARNGAGRGEVFALIPMGRARRGAEWVGK